MSWPWVKRPMASLINVSQRIMVERSWCALAAILAETLLHAKNIGLDRVLLTCDTSNAASAKVIKRNDGVFHSERLLSDHLEIVQRYWIDL